MFGRAAVLCAVAFLAGVIPASGQTSTPPAAAPAPAQASASPEQARLLKSTEAFVRRLFGWAPDVQVTLGPLGASTAAEYYVVPVVIKIDGQTQSGQVFVSKDGKTLLRGEVYDMAADPFAENRAKIHLEGNPSKGPASSPVTVVEYADFQCPHCRELAEAMPAIEAQYPQMRVVYKDYPLTQIHPWAETAAIGGRCAYTQSPEAFWKVHDSIFENQDVISTEDIWDKLVEFATQAGLNADTFKACLASPEAQKAVAANHAEGDALGVSSTPTLYVNGRPLVGGDPATLVQYLNFEIAASKK